MDNMWSSDQTGAIWESMKGHIIIVTSRYVIPLTALHRTWLSVCYVILWPELCRIVKLNQLQLVIPINQSTVFVVLGDIN